MFQNVLLFIHFENVQDWLYVEHYLLQQTIRSMLLCVTQNNNSSLSNTHVDHNSHLVFVRSVGFLQLTAWLAAQWCGLVVMYNDQHLVTNHTKSQISQERRAVLPSPFTGRCLHMCSLKKCITHSQVTTCQLYFLVPLSSFLAHLLALSHMQMNSRKQVMWAETNTVTASSELHQTLFKFQCHPPWPGSCQNSWYVLTIDFTLWHQRDRQRLSKRQTAQT